MNKLILATSIIAAFACSASYAEEAAAPAAEPVPDNVVAYNVGATTDYRFRGISQSRLKPAVFGGIDYTNNPTGFYAGTWASSIKWIEDQGGDASAEIDIYGGKRGEISGVAYDLGLIRYYYPSNSLGVSANTTEAYVQAGYGPAYIKYSYALTNFIGWAAGSKGSNYIDVGYNPEIKDGYILNLHVGKQVVKEFAVADYSDWKIGVTKDFGFAVAAIAVVGTDADKATYTWGSNNKFTGKTGVTASLTKSF
jgi:uncharacterized protein (TIGR02001 family)